MTPEVRSELVKAYRDLVLRDTDRTEADLYLLEQAGLMTSHVLTDDDDFFGLDSLEPGETVFEFTRAGRKLFSEIEAEAKLLERESDGEDRT